MIIKRYVRGDKILDLSRFVARGIDEDGFMVEDECFETRIYSKGMNENEGEIKEYPSFMIAELTISANNWKEQVL